MKVLALLASVAVSFSASSTVYFEAGNANPLLGSFAVYDDDPDGTVISVTSPPGMDKVGVATPLPAAAFNLQDSSGDKYSFKSISDVPAGLLDPANGFAWKDSFLGSGGLSRAELDTEADGRNVQGYLFQNAFFKVDYSGYSLDSRNIEIQFSRVLSSVSGSDGRFVLDLVHASDSSKKIHLQIKMKCKAFSTSAVEDCKSADGSRSDNLSTSKFVVNTDDSDYRNFVVSLAPHSFEESSSSVGDIIPGTYTNNFKITFTVP